MSRQLNLAFLASVGAGSVLAGTFLLRPAQPTVPGVQPATQSQAPMAGATQIKSVGARAIQTPPAQDCGAITKAFPPVTAGEDPTCRKAFTEFFVRNGLCGGARDKNKYLIATLPDPIESRLNVQFDQNLAAIMLALSNEHALTDFWLPWTVDREIILAAQRGLSVEVAPRDGKTSIRPQMGNCREKWPGVMLFSGHAEDKPLAPPQRVVLLLVSELATTGVQKNLLQISATLAANQMTTKNGVATVSIIGPQFSGSAWSLRSAFLDSERLNERAIDATTLDVAFFTGSATNPNNQKVLTFESKAIPKIKTRFAATVIPDDAATQSFYEYLVRAKVIDSPDSNCVMVSVALLREAETVYGQAFTSRHSRTEGSCSGRFRPRYEIHFPVHIADVRVAWQKEGTPHQVESVSPLIVPKISLRVDLQDRPIDARDDVATFSPLTPATDERALASALGALRENRVEVVGIVATDTKDKLFLAEAVHRSAPDAQLFMFEGDMLFTHPDYSDILRGAMVVGTYPLVTSNQMWGGRWDSRQPQQRRPFGMSSAQGTYNATLLALRNDTGSRKEKEVPLEEYRWPLLPGAEEHYAGGAPPLWITTIGRNAFWPLAVVDYERKEYCPDRCLYLRTIPPSPLEHKYTQVPTLDWSPAESLSFIVAFAAVFGLYLLLVASLTRDPPEEHVGPEMMRLFEVAGRDLSTALRRRWATGAVIFVFAILLFVCIWLGALAFAAGVIRLEFESFANIRRETPKWQGVRFIASVVACASCAQAIADAAYQRLAPTSAVSSERRRRYRILVFIMGILLFFPLIHWTSRVLYVSDSNLTGLFAYWRAFHLGSGLSPVVPTLSLLAVPGLAALNLLRILYLDDEATARGLFGMVGASDSQAPPDCLFVDPKPLRSGLADFGELWRGTEAQRPMRDVGFWGPRAIGAAFVLAPVLWTMSTVKGRLDPGWGQRVLPVLMALAVLICLVHVWHLWRVWHRMHRWLGKLAQLHLSAAFKRVRLESKSRVGLGSRMRLPSHNSIGLLQRECADALTNARVQDRSNEPIRNAATALAGLRSRLGPAIATRPMRRVLSEAESHAVELENVVALWHSYVIGACVARLRGTWFVLAMSALAIALAIGSYPLYPQRELIMLGWMVVGASVTGVTGLFIGMNRNEVMSHLAGTDPDEVTWDSEFVAKLLAFGALPILGLITAQFPEVARAIASLLDPIFRGIH